MTINPLGKIWRGWHKMNHFAIKISERASARSGAAHSCDKHKRKFACLRLKPSIKKIANGVAGHDTKRLIVCDCHETEIKGTHYTQRGWWAVRWVAHNIYYRIWQPLESIKMPLPLCGAGWRKRQSVGFSRHTAQLLQDVQLFVVSQPAMSCVCVRLNNHVMLPFGYRVAISIS